MDMQTRELAGRQTVGLEVGWHADMHTADGLSSGRSGWSATV